MRDFLCDVPLCSSVISVVKVFAIALTDTTELFAGAPRADLP